MKVTFLRSVRAMAIATAVGSVLFACSAPLLTYQDVSQSLFPTGVPTAKGASTATVGTSDTAAASTPSVLPALNEGEILYALRTTNITLNPPASAGATPKPNDACQTNNGATPIANDARNCLIGVTAVPSPAPFQGGVFKVTPGARNPFVTVKLSPAPVSGNQLLVTSVAVVYSDNTTKAIAAVAAGAAAGIPLGPVGIAAGALGAGLGQLPHDAELANSADVAGIVLPPVSPPPPALTRDLYRQLLCKADAADWNTSSIPKTPTLMLPVAIGLTEDGETLERDPLEYKTDKTQPCWHTLPTSPKTWTDPSVRPTVQTSGWLYRVVAAEPPTKQFGVESKDEFLTSVKQASTTTPMTVLPVTPCQKATVEFIWYLEAEADLEAKFKSTQPIKASDIRGADVPLRLASSAVFDVANPYYVQPLQVPKGGTINLDSVCGGYVSYQVTATTLTETAATAIAAANSYLEAQKANKAKAK